MNSKRKWLEKVTGTTISWQKYKQRNEKGRFKRRRNGEGGGERKRERVCVCMFVCVRER